MLGRNQADGEGMASINLWLKDETKTPDRNEKPIF